MYRETEREKRARKAGENGHIFFPSTLGEYIAYNKGKNKADNRGDDTNSGELIRFTIIQILHNSAYVFLGYKTTILIFFGSTKNYWPSDSIFEMFMVLGITPLMALFYAALADFFRTKMLSLKARKDDRWKIISKALFVTDVAGPGVLAWYLTFKIGINFFKGGFMFSALALLIAFSVAVLFYDYLKKRFDQASADDDKRIEARRFSNDSNTASNTINAEYIPEGHRYAPKDGGLTGVFIFFAIVIAIIMYLNSHS